MSSPTIDFQGLLDRAIAVCKEAVSGSDGVAYAIHSQELFPYFTGRINNVTMDKDGDEIDQYEVTFTIVHVTGNRTAGYAGEAENKLYTQLPAVMATLLSRDLLQSAAYPIPLDYHERTELVQSSGYGFIDGAGIGATGEQVATTYTLRAIFHSDNIQDYL